jgi:hypothetical protein
MDRRGRTKQLSLGVDGGARYFCVAFEKYYTIMSNKTRFFFAALLLLVLSLPNCYYDNEQELYGGNTCDTTSVTYSAEVTSVLQNNCYGCHDTGTDYPLNSYDLLRPYATGGLLLQRMRDASNPMPPSGILDSCSIHKIDAWVREGALDN